jgi:short subunit dehydrogenase-like uncharacterized protein
VRARIALLGATGFTGRLIARRLDRAGIPFTIGARDAARAHALQAELETRPAAMPIDVTQAAQVARVVDDADIVISCVGPYSVYGRVLLEHCRCRPLLYLDVTGEQEFVRASLAADATSPARASIVHSVAFESALADLLAAELVAPHAQYRSIGTYYSFAKSRPSPGTHLTMRVAPHFPAYRLQAGVLHETAPFAFEAALDFAAPAGETAALFVPYPEVLFFGGRYRTADAGSFVLMSDAEALFARAARSVGATRPLATILAQHARQRRAGPGQTERAQQRFTLTLHAVAADGSRRTGRLAGCDMYGITALLVQHVVEAVLAGATVPPGVHAPAALPVWDGIWARLEAERLVAAPTEID